MTTSHITNTTDGSETRKAIVGVAVKFNKFNVSCGEKKVRVFYSLDNRHDEQQCVTLYAKDYGHGLRSIFGDLYENKTDLAADYFDQGRVVLFESHPLYAVARTRVEGDEGDMLATSEMMECS